MLPSGTGEKEPVPSVRRARVYVKGVFAGTLMELDNGSYRFEYSPDYTGQSVSLTMPLKSRVLEFSEFPPFFEGLLPEGEMLKALLRQRKIDGDDLFSQLLAVGGDTVGAVTVDLSE